MADEISLSGMKTSMQSTQAEFLKMLDSADDTTLYKNHDAENWSLSVMLSHLIESRTFNTAGATNVLKNPGANVGRSMDADSRMDAIIGAQHTQVPSVDLRQRLIASYDGIMALLNSMTDADLAIPVNHARLGQVTMGQYMSSIFVGHEQAHVEQAKSFLQPNA